jgi:hypothetical protein
MMKTETVLETSVSFIHMTRLNGQEDFIEYIILAYTVI